MELRALFFYSPPFFLYYHPSLFILHFIRNLFLYSTVFILNPLFFIFNPFSFILRTSCRTWNCAQSFFMVHLFSLLSPFFVYSTFYSQPVFLYSTIFILNPLFFTLNPFFFYSTHTLSYMELRAL